MSKHNPSLADLETSILSRNPKLALKLRDGLSEQAIREGLEASKLEGMIEPVIELFSWRNGVSPDSEMTLSEASIFPNSVYQFLDFESALQHVRELEQVAEFNAALSRVLGRYLPLFWDNATGYIVIDLAPGSRKQIMLMEFQSDQLLRKAYTTFDDFVSDAIRANREDENLTCFDEPA